jgi:transcriptional regulator with XRE-family HTH domain
MEDFYSRLHGAIKNAGMTQDEISSKSGVSCKTLQNWTRTKPAPTMPRLHQGVKVAIVLGVSPEYLVTGKDPSGLSPEALQIAIIADKLTKEGKAVAYNQVEGLLKLYDKKGSKQERAGA